MSNASENRRNGRIRTLAKLAGNPDASEFITEWNKRVKSWAYEAIKQKDTLKDKNGRPTPPIFSIVSKALTELRDCAQQTMDRTIYEKLRVETHDTLTAVCCTVMASAIDSHGRNGVRIYRLSNEASNYDLMHSGTHKPRQGFLKIFNDYGWKQH